MRSKPREKAHSLNYSSHCGVFLLLDHTQIFIGVTAQFEKITLMLCRGKHFDKQIIGMSSWDTTLVNKLTEIEENQSPSVLFVNLKKSKILFFHCWPLFIVFFGVLTHLEWSEQCVFIDVREGMTQHSTLITNSLNTEEREDCVGCSESCVCINAAAPLELWITKMINYSCLLVLWS